MDREQLRQYALSTERSVPQLFKIIEQFLEVTSRSLPRPDLHDVTTRKLLASELAGKIARAE